MENDSRIARILAIFNLVLAGIIALPRKIGKVFIAIGEKIIAAFFAVRSIIFTRFAAKFLSTIRPIKTVMAMMVLAVIMSACTGPGVRYICPELCAGPAPTATSICVSEAKLYGLAFGEVEKFVAQCMQQKGYKLTNCTIGRDLGCLAKWAHSCRAQGLC